MGRKSKLDFLTYEILEQLHNIERKSMMEISKIYGTTYHTVFNRAKYVGFVTRNDRKINAKLKDLTYEILYQLHWVDGLSLKSIGKLYNARSCSVSEHIVKLGFVAKDSNSKKSEMEKLKLKDLTYDKLYQLYCVERKTATDIAKTYNVKSHYITNCLINFNIPLRSSINKLENLTYDVLYQLYCVEQKSLTEISNLYDCYHHLIKKHAENFGIEIRDSATATKLAVSGSKHHNWKGENRKAL